MLRRLALGALAALLLLPAGCGGDDPPPAGPPRDRFGPEAVDGILAVERIRSQLVPVSDLVALGRHEEAADHLAAARDLWQDLAAEVRGRDAVLAREIDVAFDRAGRAVGRRATFDAVRDLTSPLGAQLLGGVREALVEREARTDSGVNAAVVVRLLDRIVAEYAAGDEASRRHAFGLIGRAQSVAREIAGDLGPRRADVIDALRDLRSEAFPEGVAPTAEPPPPAEVRERAGEIAVALRERFRLTG